MTAEKGMREVFACLAGRDKRMCVLLGYERQRASRLRTLAVTVLGVVVTAIAGRESVPVQIWYNPSASAPVGWYVRVPAQSLGVDDFALIRLPLKVAELAAERRYLPRTVPMLKHVAGRSGQHVCEHRGTVIVEGHYVGHALVQDHMGRALSAWEGCRKLGEGEYFLMSRNSTASFDSRYFGPVTEDRVIGRAIPLWTK